MDHDPSLVELQAWVEDQALRGADRGLVDLGRQVVKVLEWMEARLDVLDNRDGA